jgi:hypothetical protein
MQALAEGDLSERARRRAAELARDADLRLNPPQGKGNRTTPSPEPVTIPTSVDHRLPPPGTILTRPYKGQLLQVQVRTILTRPYKGQLLQVLVFPAVFQRHFSSL